MTGVQTCALPISCVQDIIAAVTGSTPALIKCQNHAGDWIPTSRPNYHSQEHQAGYEAHIWTTNLCETRRTALLRYIANQPAFTVQHIDDYEVVFRDHNGSDINLSFDLDAVGCDAFDPVATSSCMDAVTVDCFKRKVMQVTICCAGYPLDMTLNQQQNPTYPFIPLVDENVLGGTDPGWDGWDGFSVTRRFDSTSVLDSMGPLPQGRQDCVFPEYIVRELATASVTFPEIQLVQGFDASYTIGPP